MSANYKNWVPNEMITALTAGTAILGAGTAALMFADMNPMMKKALVGTAGAGTLVCGAMAAWSVYAHGKFSYDGKRQLSKEIVEGTAKYVTLPEGGIGLDVGCGSGILSIVALKLGASEVVGTDLDADCMISTHENMKVNHLDEKLGTFYVGNLIDDVDLQKQVGTEEYDIVVANILADVIIPMAPVIPDRLRKGGYFITSGIIDFKEDEVRDAIEKTGLKVIEINHQGEWVNITAQKL